MFVNIFNWATFKEDSSSWFSAMFGVKTTCHNCCISKKEFLIFVKLNWSLACSIKLSKCCIMQAGRLVQMAILAELHPCSCSNFATEAAFGSVLLFKAAFWCSVCPFHREGIGFLCRLLQGRIQKFFILFRKVYYQHYLSLKPWQCFAFCHLWNRCIALLGHMASPNLPIQKFFLVCHAVAYAYTQLITHETGTCSTQALQ